MFSRSTRFERSDKFFDIRSMKSFFLRGYLYGFRSNTRECSLPCVNSRINANRLISIFSFFFFSSINRLLKYLTFSISREEK